MKSGSPQWSYSPSLHTQPTGEPPWGLPFFLSDPKVNNRGGTNNRKWCVAGGRSPTRGPEARQTRRLLGCPNWVRERFGAQWQCDDGLGSASIEGLRHLDRGASTAHPSALEAVANFRGGRRAPSRSRLHLRLIRRHCERTHQRCARERAAQDLRSDFKGQPASSRGRRRVQWRNRGRGGRESLRGRRVSQRPFRCSPGRAA